MDTVIDKAGNSTYKIYRLEHDTLPVLYQTVIEEAKLMSYSIPNVVDQEKVAECVRKLLEKGYFVEPKTHLEIFKKCTELLGISLNPLSIISEISVLTRQHKKNKLIKGPNTETARATIVCL